MTDIIPLKDYLTEPAVTPQAGKVGLLAGAGRFPMVFAETARQCGLKVYGMGVMGMADENLADLCDYYQPFPLAKIGQSIRWFKRQKIENVVMAGKIEKTVLFQPQRFWRLMPDWRAIHMWLNYARENKKDDTLLLAVIREYARDNIHFASALDYCPELLVKHGFLSRRKPNSSQWKDICFGWEMAKELGRLDIGQTVVVYDTAVIAVEAIEGTDQAILRAGELCKRGGFTVVKVAKPQQDNRFDVPTIGVQTLRSMHEAGGRVLAIESGQTIIIDEPDVIELADKLGIAIVALNAEEVQLRVAC
ncbi:MAG: UDP-2,3-diacylglucosamine diphosphatase LpxI [Planctomycetaceae bacterium]|nr:UDP-2,3-diacylglucosamine diphosphatase LpxI [Planctomycetaceae bacterium]